MERTLIVILAETRAFEYTYEGFRENLMKVFNADLALCVGSGPHEDVSNPFYRDAKYIWTYDEKQDWADSLDEVADNRGGGGEWRLLLHHKGILFGGVKGIGGQPGSGAIGLFFRAFLKDRILENGLKEKYDRFILTRSDFVYEISHVSPDLLDNETIWIPDGESYGGVTDRHILCPSDMIIEYLSCIDQIFTSPKQLYYKMDEYNQGMEWNIESFLKFAMIDNRLFEKVKFFPYTMYTVRGDSGLTRWSGGDFNKKKGVYIKYEEEFRRSMYAKRILGKKGVWSKSAIKRHADTIRRREKLTELRHKLKKPFRRTLFFWAVAGAYYLGTLT